MHESGCTFMSFVLPARVCLSAPTPLSGPRHVAWVREAALPQVDRGMELTALTIQYFGEFFGVPFPLPKLDMISPPEMGPNAMENWGLVTYR